MAKQAETQVAPTRLWVRVLLVVSLALNLLVIGAVAGFAIKGGPIRHAGMPPMAEGGFGLFTRALSKEDRRAIGREIRQKGRENGWDRQAQRQAMRRMLTLLEARPFDAQAFNTEMQTVVESVQGRLSDASGALVARLTQMSDAERASYAASIREMIARKRP